MLKTNLILATAFSVACCFSGASVADQGLKLYPVRGLFVDKPDSGESLINENFSKGVDNAEAGAYFESEFRKIFPEAISVLAEKDRRNTLVTSLQISRASNYSVDKVDGTSDIYIPVSGSIYFTNVVTGEVLYTASSTYYYRTTVAGSGKSLESTKLQAMFKTAYEGLVTDLLGKAKMQFNPHVVSATVKQEWNGLYILDKGENQGIAKGDSISDSEGNTLNILFSDSSYSVGLADLGKISIGKAFSKESNSDLSDIKKPRVMIMINKSPEGFPPEILRQLFSDALGSKTPVSVVQVNKLFSDVLKTAFSGQLSAEYSRQRELPDFFIRLSIPESTDFELPTSLSYKTIRTYSTTATAELVDKSGRVLYAASGTDKIVDDVTSGMSFDRSSRREVSIKNALVSLANRIGKELQFKQLEMPVISGGDSVSIKDELGILTQEESLTAYRKIGKVAGISEVVQVPIRGLNVATISDGIATATLDLPLTKTPLNIAAGDLVVLDQSSTPSLITRKRFSACGPTVNLGSIDLPAFGDLAINTFEQTFTAPFYLTSFLPEVKGLLGPGTRFKSDIELKAVTSEYCVEPVYHIDINDHKCDGNPRICVDSANVRITLRIKNGNAIVTKSGLATKMMSSGYMENTSPEAQKNSLTIDLLDESSKLAKDIAAKQAKITFN